MSMGVGITTAMARYRLLAHMPWLANQLTLNITFATVESISWIVRSLSLISQRVHVGIWYIPKAPGVAQKPTLWPKYIPCNYMDFLGSKAEAILPRNRHG